MHFWDLLEDHGKGDVFQNALQGSYGAESNAHLHPLKSQLGGGLEMPYRG